MLIKTTRSQVITGLRYLQRVSHAMFSCFLSPEYPDNLYFFERNFHLQKVKYMQSIVQLRELNRSANHKPALSTFINKLDHCYDILLDCAQLRYRVKDHATFTLCALELTAINQEITATMAASMAKIANKKQSFDFTALTEKIMSFETSYHTVLQISAREPLVFLLFMTSLKALADELQALYHCDWR